jgi:hypothetical protein
MTAPTGAVQFVRARAGIEDLPRRPANEATYAVERAVFKFLPVCFSLHSVVYTVRELLREMGASSVDRVMVTGPPRLANFMSEIAENALARRFNLRYAVAEEILHGLAPGRPLHLADSEVRALAARVSLVPAPSGAKVSLWSHDGKCLEGEIAEQVPYPAEDELVAHVRQKFLAAVEPRARHERGVALWDYLMGIDSVQRVDLRTLI